MLNNSNFAIVCYESVDKPLCKIKEEIKEEIEDIAGKLAKEMDRIFKPSLDRQFKRYLDKQGINIDKLSEDEKKAMLDEWWKNIDNVEE